MERAMKIQIVKKGSNKVKTAGNVCPWLVDIDINNPKK
jgi:hypothetical protein